MRETPLEAVDRCDRCSARAQYQTRHQAGPLYWCDHHYRQHVEALTRAIDYHGAGQASMVR